MDRGTYVAASAGMAQMRKLEIVNNNLANINTPGFKRLILVGEEQTFDQTLAGVTAKDDPYARGDHDRMPSVTNLQSEIDFSQGPIAYTGGNLDAALRDPKDFFVISTPAGLQYSRAGNFTLTSGGELVQPDGMQVQGDGGPIAVSTGKVTINDDGSVRSNGTVVGRLQVVRFEDPAKQLIAAGGTRYALKPNTTPPQQVDPRVIGGSLEMANVSAISSMIDIIAASRGFQMYTKSAESIDTMNQAAISQIGRPR